MPSDTEGTHIKQSRLRQGRLVQPILAEGLSFADSTISRNPQQCTIDTTTATDYMRPSKVPLLRLYSY